MLAFCKYKYNTSSTTFLESRYCEEIIITIHFNNQVIDDDNDYVVEQIKKTH